MAPAATFRFNTKFDQTLLLGKKAGNVAELYQGVRAGAGCVDLFYTHKFLQQQHYLSPEPPSDFAYWTTHVLTSDGGRTAVEHRHRSFTIAALRQRIADVIEGYLQSAYPRQQIRRSPQLRGGKAAALRHWLRDQEFDFVLAVGDDHDDEELFAALPAQGFSIRVGIVRTAARFNLREPRTSSNCSKRCAGRRTHQRRRFTKACNRKCQAPAR